jgi:hypothetical protein
VRVRPQYLEVRISRRLGLEEGIRYLEPRAKMKKPKGTPEESPLTKALANQFLDFRAVYSRPLIETIDDVGSTWSIQRLVPNARTLSDRDRKSSAQFGLSLCNLALELDEDEPLRHRIFRTGTRIVSGAGFMPFIPRYLQLLSVREVKSRPSWTWKVIGILLEFEETAGGAALMALDLKLEKDDDLRDKLIICMLERESCGIPVSVDCVEIIAKRVVEGSVQYSNPKNRPNTEKLAKKWLLANPT